MPTAVKIIIVNSIMVFAYSIAFSSTFVIVAPVQVLYYTMFHNDEINSSEYKRKIEAILGMLFIVAIIIYAVFADYGSSPNDGNIPHMPPGRW